jgi:hypothetical protein
MKYLTKFGFLFALLLPTLGFAIGTQDPFVLNLSAAKKIEFQNLSDAVQTLMKNEAQFAERARQMAEKSKLKLANIKAGRRDCDDDSGGNHRGDYRCVQNCTWRSSLDGSCNTYGADFCGENAVCVENCTWRSNLDGSCNTYGPDLCY